jgi:hypothetical protein
MKGSEEGSQGLQGRALGLGLNIVVAALLFGFLGRWIGSKVGAQDVLTLVGGLVGGSAGFYSLYLQVAARPKTDEEKKPE